MYPHFLQLCWAVQGRKILEINPDHSIVRGIKTLLVEKDEERARDLAELLYETSLITSGFQVRAHAVYRQNSGAAVLCKQGMGLFK